jgi:hypothetical protein
VQGCVLYFAWVAAWLKVALDSTMHHVICDVKFEVFKLYYVSKFKLMMQNVPPTWQELTETDH